jgi:hypothetical protein
LADIKSVVVERDINPYHTFLSSFFAGFAEMGMINQGTMNIVSRRAANYLYSYLEAKEILSKLQKFDDVHSSESIRYHVEVVNQILNLMGNYELSFDEQGGLDLQIAANRCRICPKGVGGAAIKGTFCPIPTFIEKLVNLMIGKDVLNLQSTGITKVDTTCVANFSTQNSKPPLVTQS